MHYPLWDVSDDGSIEYLPVTNKYLQQTLTLVGNIFFKQESIAKAIELDKKPEAITELLETLILDVINHGISYVAVEKETGNVVACQINILAVKNEEETSYYERFKLKHKLAQKYIKISAELDEAIDIFNLLKTDCYMEPMVTAVLPQYRRQGVFKVLSDLTKQSMDLIKNGQNVQVNLDGVILELSPNQPIPTCILGYCTVIPTTKVCLAMGFKILAEIQVHNLETFKEISSKQLVAKVDECCRKHSQ